VAQDSLPYRHLLSPQNCGVSLSVQESLATGQQSVVDHPAADARHCVV